MNKKFSLLFLTLISMLFGLATVKADAFANAVVTLDKNKTGKVSDDSIIVTGMSSIPSAGAFKATVAGSAGTDNGNCINSLSGAYDLTYIEGSQTGDSSTRKYKVSIPAANLTNLEKENAKIYVRLYWYTDSNCYLLAEANSHTNGKRYYELSTPTVAERAASIKFTFDNKNTSALTDDIIKINNFDINDSSAELAKYKVVLYGTGTNGSQITPSEGTSLTKSGSYYTIASSYYVEKAQQFEVLHLALFYDNNKLRDDYFFYTNSTSEALKNLKIEVTGNTATSQTDTTLKLSGVNINNYADYVVVASKSSTMNDQMSTTPETGSSCSIGSDLEEKGSGNSKYYQLKNNVCYVTAAERKGDTYVAVYRKIETPPTGECVETVNSQGMIELSCPFVATVQTNTFKRVTNPVKVNRPADLELGKRINMLITPTSSLFYLNNLASFSGGATVPSPTLREASYSIGEIEDKTILRNIRDDKSGAYSDLLEYAKKATAINSGKIKIYPTKNSVSNADQVQGALYSQTEIKAGSYYFVYINYDGKTSNSNVEYYPLEEVQVFSTKKNSAGQIEFVSKEDTNWDGLGEAKEESKSTKKNPKTGFISYSLVMAIIFITGIIIFIKTKKVTKFPQS